MRHFSHDELHELLEKEPELAAGSRVMHAQPKPDSFHAWRIGKLQMTLLNVRAAGCRNQESVTDSIKEAADFLEQHGRSLDELKGKEYFDECLEVVRAMSRVRSKRGLCHSPNGNDLVCFCR